MELLKHFEQETKNFIVLHLKDAEWDEFVNKLPPGYKESYISEEDLQKKIKTFSSSKEKEFSEILPTEGSIMSGDFGEILAYFIFKERHKKHNVDGPKKWRWKEDRNVPAPFTDVILFSVKQSNKPSKEDTLISVESKMKATASKTYFPIENAIKGAEKDYVSRIANSLSWLRKKYKDESLKENAPTAKLKELVEIMDRFIKSETTGEYTKHVKAVAFVDKTFLKVELEKTYTLPSLQGASLEIIVVSVKDLKAAYEKVYKEIPKL